MRKDKPLHTLFLSIFTLVAFVWMTNPWHLLTYGDVIRYLHGGTRKSERESVDECVFLFLLCANGVPSILRGIFRTSLHAPIMNATRIGRFIFSSAIILSLSLLFFSCFLFYAKEKNDASHFS
jgi:hypothetical protein